MRMPSQRIMTAELGLNVASFIADGFGQPIVIVNSSAAHDPVVRAEAMRSLSSAGIDPGPIFEVLDGIRS